MSKKRKAKRKHKQPSGTAVAAPLDLTEWRTRLETQVEASDWQKAALTALAVDQCAGHTDADINRCMAVAEVALREWIEDGRENRFRRLVASIQKQYPAWSAGWPLGLQVAARVIPDLKARLQTAAFTTDLRQEIWNPIELAWSDQPAWQQDGEHLLQAWQQVERRDFAAARRHLGQISRQSPLIDWRLLLQALMAAHLLDKTAAQAAAQRIDEKSPARHVAAAFIPAANQDPGAPAMDTLVTLLHPPTLRRTVESVISRAVDTSDESMERVVTTALELQQAGRHEWASALPVAFGEAFSDDDGEFIDILLRTLVARDRRLGARCKLRATADAETDPDVLPQRIMSAANVFEERGLGLSAHERAVIGLIMCRGMRHFSEDSQPSFLLDLDDDTDEFGDPELLIVVARSAVACWPELDELYECWHYAEQQLDQHSCEALTHWSRHDPENVEVLVRCINELIQNKLFKRAEAALARLRKFPGERRQYTTFRNLWARYRCKDAYVSKKRAVIQGMLKQPEDLTDDTIFMLRLVDQLLTKQDFSLAAIFENLGDGPAYFWQFIRHAVAFAPSDRVGEFVEGKAVWIEQHADELANAWLAEAGRDDSYVVYFLMSSVLQDSVNYVMKGTKAPQQLFAMVLAILRVYFDPSKWTLMRGSEDFRNELVARMTVLCRQSNPNWQAAGLGLAACIALDQCLEDDEFESNSRLTTAVDLLFSAMLGHPVQGPEVQEIWVFIGQQGLQEEVHIRTMHESGIRTVLSAIQHVRSVNGLIKQAVRCARDRPVWKKAKPKPPAKTRKQSRSHPDHQMDFPDLEETP